MTTVTESQTEETTAEHDDSNSSFGAGIFTDENGNMQLSDRLKSLARGEGPEDNPADEEERDNDDDQEPVAQKTVPKEELQSPESKFSDDDKALAAKYEISDEELSEFGSPAALKRAVAVIERTASKFADNKPADGASTKVVDASQNDGAVGDKKEEAAEDIDLDALAEAFSEDPESVKVVKAVGKALAENKSLREVVDRLEKREQEREQEYQVRELERVAATFHDKLDSMPSEFGLSKNGKISAEHEAARIKVRDAAETIYQGYVAQGKTPPELNAILDQAIRMTHGVPRKADDKRVALRAQSGMRRATGSSAAAASRQPPVKTDGSPEAIAASPKIKEFWQRAQEENGSVR
jgi:hypothetical protein